MCYIAGLHRIPRYGRARTVRREHQLEVSREMNVWWLLLRIMALSLFQIVGNRYCEASLALTAAAEILGENLSFVVLLLSNGK